MTMMGQKRFHISKALFAGAIALGLSWQALAEDKKATSEPAFVAMPIEKPGPYETGFDAMTKKAGKDKVSVVITISGKAIGKTGEDALKHVGLESDSKTIAAAQETLIAFLRKERAEGIQPVVDLPFVSATFNAAQLRALAASGLVANIEQVQMMQPSLAQSLPIIKAPAFWATNSHKGQGQIVVIIDTGIASGHPFLAGRLHSEACFSSNAVVAVSGVTYTISGSCPTSSTTAGSGAPCIWSGCSHGTHVAGIAVGKQNGSPAINGVAPEAKYIAINVFGNATSSLGSGIVTIDPDLLSALGHIKTLKQAGAPIASVNMSLGGGQFTTPCGGAMELTLNFLSALGVAPVVSSGNSGYANAVGSPGCAPSAITVAATDKSNAITYYSNLSAQVDLLAPGGKPGTFADGIQSSTSPTGYVARYGTSMAAPHTAGAYALLRQRFPCYPVSVLTAKLQATGTPISRSGTLGSFPLIDLVAARTALATKPLQLQYLCAKKADTVWLPPPTN